MDTNAAAQRFAWLCEEGKSEEAGEASWADGVVSVEAMEGGGAVSAGKAAVRGKGEWWYADHEVHSAETRGPYVNGRQFALRFVLDVTPEAGGKRTGMDEIGLYTAEDGKVVEERFFYGMG